VTALRTDNQIAVSTRRRLLRSLRHRNYRRFFIGQGVSLVGTWMQQTAMIWLVYRLTQDAFLVGLNTFASQIPSLLLLPVGGVLADRMHLLRLVIATQTLAMVQAFVLAALVLFNVCNIWQLMVLAFGLGCVNAFDMPARQALLPDLLETREDLANAIALNSSLFNAARLVGPALAGLMASLVDDGEGWCFLLNGLSFLAVLVSLATIHVRPARPHPKPGPILHGLIEGLRFASSHPPIRAVLVLVAIMGFVGMPYTVLVPVFAKEVLRGDARTYGLLLTASGVGALAGAIYLANRVTIRGSGRRIVVAGVAGAASMLVFAWSDNFALSLGLVVLIGAAMMLVFVSCNAIVQSIVPDAMRGRVMSLYTLAFMGLTPFGALVGGYIATKWGPSIAMVGCAVGCLAGALLFVPRLGVVRAAIRAHVAGAQSVPTAESIAPTDYLSPELSEDVPHV
jgi:MFS family permease